mgnify:CR=1 FL=1
MCNGNADLHQVGAIRVTRKAACISRRRFVEVGVIHHATILVIEILFVNHIMKDIFK